MSLAWLSLLCRWPGCLCCVIGLAVFAVSLAWLSLLCRWPGCLCCVVGLAVFAVSLAWLSLLCRWPGCLCCVVGLAVFAVSLAWLYHCSGVGLAMSLVWGWPGYVFGVGLACLGFHCWLGSEFPVAVDRLYIYPPDNVTQVCLPCCIRHRTELLTEHCKCRETLEPENKGL